MFTRTVDSRFHVRTPYSDEFVLFAHEHDGRWKRRSNLWSFKRYQYVAVAKALNRIFGTNLPGGEK